MLGHTVANRYKITEEAGQDSLTIHYKALDSSENKPVFITILKEKAKQRPLETLLRFKRQIEQVSKLNHPSLLKIYSQGEFEGQDYIVKEFFDSKPLATYLGQPLQIDTAVEIILQISSALDLAHQNNILHQALQPQQILISQDLRTARLTNFGCNLLTDISRITETQEIISTFGYLSPESSGILRKPIDARSDIYSLGILFYQLITGRLPYTAQDVSTLIHQHIAQIPEAPSKYNTQIPPVIDNITLRLIAKDPQDRYQSLTGLIADLKEYQKQRATGKALIDFEIARFDKLRQLSFSTRLIGRDKEMEQLKNLLNQTKQSKGGLCFVFGEPGIGKSRLVDELRVQVHSLNGLFCGGKCYQYEFRTPYKVFSEAIDAYIEKVRRLSQKEQEIHIKRIKETLGELGGEVVKIAPTIIDIIGHPPKLVELEPEKEKIRFLITVTNFLTSLSTHDTPLLVFLDDLQWVDDGSLEILARVAEKLPNTSTLLIVSYRDNEVDQNHPLAQLIRKLTEQNILLLNIPVKSFSLSETARMICQILLEKEERVLPLANELQERAKGNPFFTLELLHSLVDSEVVFLKEDHYTYDLEKLKTVSLPTSIVDAVLKRMNDLEEEDLEIISYASIMGKEIEFKLLTELARKPADKIVISLEDGIRNQLLFRDLTGQENIFFMHDRIREAFYKRVPDEERIPLHKHIAEVLEEQNKDNPDTVLYDLAHHFIQGKVEDKALQYSIPAAHKARSSYAHTLAIDLYNNAKEILEKRNKQQSNEYIETLDSLGESYRMAGRFDESLKVLKTCESLVPAHNKVRKAQVLTKIGYTYLDKGEMDESTKILEQALRILEVRVPRSQLGVIMGIGFEFNRQMLHTLFPRFFVSSKYKASIRDLIIVRLFNRLANIYYFSDMNKVFYLFLRSLNFSEKLGPCPELAFSYVNGGPAWAALFWFSRSFRDMDKGIKMAREIGDKIMEGMGYSFHVLVSNLANKPKQGLEYANKAITLLKGLGAYWELGIAYAMRNHNNWIAGRIKEAISENKEGAEVAKEANALQPFGWGLMDGGHIQSFIGGADETVIRDIQEGHRLMVETRDRPNAVWSLCQLAFAYLRRGEYSQATQTIEEAARLFPTHYNLCNWILDVFPTGAQIYLDVIVNTADLSKRKKKECFMRAFWFCKQSFIWSKKIRYLFAWSLQVNGTYLWLTGKKKKAVRTWENGLKFLRENKNNPGGDKYRIAYILLEEAKFLLQDNPKDKKAYSNLIEARDLFTEMGCKLDLETTNKLLESLSPEGLVVDSRQVLTQKRHLDSLLSVTQAIGSIFVLQELLERIVEYALKVTGAERGFLLLYDDEKDKQLKLKVCRGLEKELTSLSFSYENYKISLELINEVGKNKEAMIVEPHASQDSKIVVELKSHQVKQVIAVPLKTQARDLGVIYMDNRMAGGMFGIDELSLMKSFAVQASVSIENAYLVANLVEQERLKQEMELGRDIQMNLLPTTSPDIPGLKISGLMIPAKEIGGDYYDYMPTVHEEAGEKAQRLGVIIGDVSGKGVAAGLIMATAKATLKGLSQQDLNPKQILSQANSVLFEYTKGQKFMTMLYFQFREKDKTLSYSSAGHEHILIYHSDTNQVESIMSGGFMLGMIPDVSQFLENRGVQLKANDKIVLYTDGVTEARNPQEDLFGLPRIIDIVSKHGSKSANELLAVIKDEVYSFIGTREQYDDITLVVMEAT